eukprot:GHVQ01004421.1.p1 GENE.GHVQ01004421.1~~GHVQ01004421.1.p1  ORF type:complete len:375 (+),score=39.90 GHVQ01004421.1:430-1554(+)
MVSFIRQLYSLLPTRAAVLDSFCSRSCTYSTSVMMPELQPAPPHDLSLSTTSRQASPSRRLSTVTSKQNNDNQLSRVLAATAQTFGEGRKPNWDEVVKLRELVNHCSLSDIGYSREGLLKALLSSVDCKKLGLQQMPPHVIPIQSTDRYNVVVFVLPKNCGLDLHDHPGMLVLGKVLTGSVDVTAYHLVDNIKRKGDKDSNTAGDVKRSSQDVRGSANSGSQKKLSSDSSTISGRGEEILGRHLDVISKSLESYGRVRCRCPDCDVTGSAGVYRALKVFEGNISDPASVCDSEYSDVVEALFAESTAVVLPDFANVHSLKSTDEVTAMLDILTPPYGSPECRECRYFRSVNGTLEVVEDGGPEYFQDLPCLREF